jgi:hypothetical protein
MLRRVERMAGRLWWRRETLAKHIGDWGETIVRLICGYVMDVRRVGELGRLVRDMPRQGMGVVHAGKSLVEGRRLDDALVGELLMGGRHDGEPGRGLVSSRHTGRLSGELVVLVTGAVALGRLLLQPLLDDMALLLLNPHATLELLLHNRVLGDEARRETGQANLLNAEIIPRGQWPTG